MAQTETLKLPNHVIDSDWKDDIDYEPFTDEGKYISPEKVEKSSVKRAKNIKIGRIALFKKGEKLTA